MRACAIRTCISSRGSTRIRCPSCSATSSAGIVEQVGSEVTYVQKGDHVITCLSVFCGTCEYCTSGRPVICNNGAVKLPQARPAA